MALREGAALASLAREPARMAFEQQRAERQRLAGCPVDAFAGLDRLVAALQEALDGAVDVEPLGDGGDFLADRLENGDRRAGLAAARIVDVARRPDVGPAALQPGRA